MDRILHIDRAPSDWPGLSGGAVMVVRSADVAQLYERYFVRSFPPPLFLDCRQANTWQYGQLLKFFEEFKGSLTVLAMDPVPPAVISRFVQVKKVVKEPEGDWGMFRLRNTPPSIRNKVYDLFGRAEEMEDDLPEG